MGCKALAQACYGGDAAGRGRKLRAADGGALEVMAAAMRAPDGAVEAHDAAAKEAMRGIVALCSGLDNLSKGRQNRAAEGGALDAVVLALHVKADGTETARFKAGRYRAIRNLTRNNANLVQAAKAAGAKSEWL